MNILERVVRALQVLGLGYVAGAFIGYLIVDIALLIGHDPSLSGEDDFALGSAIVMTGPAGAMFAAFAYATMLRRVPLWVSTSITGTAALVVGGVFASFGSAFAGFTGAFMAFFSAAAVLHGRSTS